MKRAEERINKKETGKKDKRRRINIIIIMAANKIDESDEKLKVFVTKLRTMGKN